MRMPRIAIDVGAFDLPLKRLLPRVADSHADGVQLHRALTNVISNAIRHAPDGSDVEIRSDRDTRQISVIDTGDGFPAHFVDEAFQPFRRFEEARDRAHGGAGLGLAVAKGIVDAIGGRIWADPGPGGRVHLTLP